MQNSAAVGSICAQLIKSCEKVQTITSAMDAFEQTNEKLIESYGNIRFDELEHIQILTLMLTELVSVESDENMDGEGSVFAPGDLNDVKKGEDEE